MPPIPESGKFSWSFWAMEAMKFRPMGRTAGPEVPLMAPFPKTLGVGTKSSSPTEEMPRTVLMAEMASAPPFLAYMAGSFISVMLGVILAITGMDTASLTAAVNPSSNWKACPTL